MFKNILVPIDGSDCSLEALELAARFARDQQARLTVCTVVDPAKAAAMAFGEASMAAACLDALDEEGRTLVQDAAGRVHGLCAADSAVLDGAPVDAIVEYARESQSDLVVMGSHGRTGLQRWFLGSVAEGVIRSAEVPVMVVRQVLVTNDDRETARSAAKAAAKAAAAT